MGKAMKGMVRQESDRVEDDGMGNEKGEQDGGEWLR